MTSSNRMPAPQMTITFGQLFLRLINLYQLLKQNITVTGFVVMGRRRREPANIKLFNNKINKCKNESMSPSRTTAGHRSKTQHKIRPVPLSLRTVVGCSSFILPLLRGRCETGPSHRCRLSLITPPGSCRSLMSLALVLLTTITPSGA